MSVRALSIFALLLIVTACGGSGGGPDTTPVLKVEKWVPSGDLQVDTAGQLLPKVIRVKVTLDGSVTAGVTVNFSGGNLGTTSMVTGDNGIATSSWTLDPTAGVQQVTATVAGAVGSPLTFTATAIPGPATTLVMAGGDQQASDTSRILALPFTARVVDQYSNGIDGRYVHWHATGSVTLPVDSLITDATGAARMFSTAGHVEGPFSVTATVDGLAGSPLTFTGAVISNPVVIEVSSYQFTPDSISVAAGSAVKWHWIDSGHSVSPVGSPTFSGSDVQNAGSTWGPILFSTPGVYSYECSNHPAMMHGKIVVN